MNNVYSITTIKEFIEERYARQVRKIVQLPDALTTCAYKVEFTEGPSYIIKIAYDPQDISEKKGEKECTVLRLLKSKVPDITTPDVADYIPAGECFEGYVVTMNVLRGKTLPVHQFTKVALSKENMDALVLDTCRYHSITYEYVTDFATFTNKSVEDYIDKYRGKAEKFLVQHAYPPALINKLETYEILKEYFADKPLALLHRDVKFNNILYDNGMYSGIIDWEGAFTMPLAFDFAHIKVLAKKYGYESWVHRYIAHYCAETQNQHLKNEIDALQLFTAFRYMCRNHESEVLDKKEEEIYLKTIYSWKCTL